MAGLAGKEGVQVSVRTSLWVRMGVGVGALVAVGLGGYPPVDRVASAQTDTVAAGGRLYRGKGDCQACHGWAGDGRKMNLQMPDGANLRESTLTREQLVFVIKCGLPGRQMPAYDRRAYVDDRCLGRTRRDLDRMGLQLFDPPATLQNREVERLADFLMARVIGQGPMDRQKCIDFWGEEAAVCRTEFPD